MAIWYSFLSFPRILNSFSNFLFFAWIYSPECCYDDGTIWLHQHGILHKNLDYPFHFSVSLSFFFFFFHFYVYKEWCNWLAPIFSLQFTSKNSLFVKQSLFFSYEHIYLCKNVRFVFSSQVVHTHLNGKKKKEVFFFHSALMSFSFPLLK